MSQCHPSAAQHTKIKQARRGNIEGHSESLQRDIQAVKALYCSDNAKGSQTKESTLTAAVPSSCRRSCNGGLRPQMPRCPFPLVCAEGVCQDAAFHLALPSCCRPI